MLIRRLAAASAASVQSLATRSLPAAARLLPPRRHSIFPVPAALQLRTFAAMSAEGPASAGPSNGASAASSAPSSPPAKKARLNTKGSTRATRKQYTPEEREQYRLEKEKTREARQGRENERRRLKAKMWNRKEQLEKFGEDPIWFDIVEMLGEEKVRELSKGEDEEQADANDEERKERSREAAMHRQRYTRGDVVELTISRISSHGDGLAVNDEGDWVVVVPKVLPGERIRARVWVNERLYSKADLVETLGAQDDKLAEMEGIDARRRNDAVGCKYFDVCSGCQYQMIPYEEQLKLKQRVVRRAFQHYSGLSDLPDVQPTLASPLPYNYRTKITPHFALPRELKSLATMKKRVRKGTTGSENLAGEIEERKTEIQEKDFLVNIGFDRLGGGSAGQGNILDIEECPIATRTINEALTGIRKTTKESIKSFQNGATLLLRDSLADFSRDETITVTEGKDTVKERVGETIFESPAGTFFQNNRSILPSLIDAVKRSILALRGDQDDPAKKHYLVDTYCGSGFFALCLADQFDEVAGVEISPESIRFAKRNAELNKRSNVTFLAGNAEDIFGTISYPPAQTTVIIDPPRRGCDDAFIKQLVKLAPASVVYVSCNVHTQARDVGSFVRASGGAYEVVSVGGLDMFPQTHHVEGLAVLRRRPEAEHVE